MTKAILWVVFILDGLAALAHFVLVATYEIYPRTVTYTRLREAFSFVWYGAIAVAAASVLFFGVE